MLILSFPLWITTLITILCTAWRSPSRGSPSHGQDRSLLRNLPSISLTPADIGFPRLIKNSATQKFYEAGQRGFVYYPLRKATKYVTWSDVTEGTLFIPEETHDLLEARSILREYYKNSEIGSVSIVSPVAFFSDLFLEEKLTFPPHASVAEQATVHYMNDRVNILKQHAHTIVHKNAPYVKALSEQIKLYESVGNLSDAERLHKLLQLLDQEVAQAEWMEPH